ncbi:MAG TPA: hypothetical protein VG270_06890 [Pseudolabrys sp.]|jgi:hypothetical protein|nr:hypothetical protein [Pseudolabrys sp.]
MPDTLNAVEMRRLAMECAARAYDSTCKAEERERMLRMREGLLSLAVNADWLAGRILPPAA